MKKSNTIRATYINARNDLHNPFTLLTEEQRQKVKEILEGLLKDEALRIKEVNEPNPDKR